MEMLGTNTMLLYTIEEKGSSDSSLQKTLFIEGSVVSSQRSQLQSLLRESLLSCDHLVVNFDKVTEFDSSLIMLLCAVDQTTQHLNKKLTIKGNDSRSFSSFYKNAHCPKSGNCLLENCFLWDTTARKSARSFKSENKQK